MPIIERAERLSRVKKLSAATQDRIVEMLYGRGGPPDIVLHGGSQAWRCYGSNRFSPDIDAYSMRINIHATLTVIEDAGLRVDKMRDTGRVIYSTISIGDGSRVKVGLEVLRAPVEGEIASYTKADGSALEVVTITADDFVREKMIAYTSRLKIRDLYDLYHVYTNVLARGTVDEELRADLARFLKTIRRPADEGTLRESVYVGEAPSYTEMVSSLQLKTNETV